MTIQYVKLTRTLRTLATILCVIGISSVARANEKRVLIISVDGLRPDLMLLADAPNLRGLMKRGSYTCWAQTISLGKTLPSHTSMLTGTKLEQHGVHWNGDDPPRGVKYKHPHKATLFELAKKQGLSTALVAGKYKFIALAKPNTVDWMALSPRAPKNAGSKGDDGMNPWERKFGDKWIGEQAAKIIQENQPQVMFTHFPRVDTVGHAKGWGSIQQLAAIASADAGIGAILEALREKGVLDETLIVVSADHGGFGRTHHGRDARGLHIPWIAAGPGMKANHDLTLHGDLAIKTEDTFATACRFLGIALPKDVVGKAVAQAFIAH